MPPIRRLALAFLLLSTGAAAASPVYKDRERFGPGLGAGPGMGPEPGLPLGEAMPPRLEPLPPYADPRFGAPPVPVPLGRAVNGGPGYVGSDYGLGKPAFTGLGTRPDWGRSE